MKKQTISNNREKITKKLQYIFMGQNDPFRLLRLILR